MATTIWRGDQASFYQTCTITATGTWATGDTATLTINGKSITVTLGSAYAVADVAEVLARAVNGTVLKGNETRNTTGNLLGEWSEITATYSGAVLTLTADVAGVPFTVTRSEVTAGDGALGAVTATVSPAGPNEMAAANLTGGSLTATNNTLVFQNSSVGCYYGLDQSSAGTWVEVDFDSTYTGYVGLPFTRSASPSSFTEYLTRYYSLRASKVVIGEGTGSGSGRILLDLGDVQTAVHVRKTGSSADTGLYAVRWKGTHADNVMYVDGGSIDIAPDSGDVATVKTLEVSGSGSVRTSPGTTLATIEVTGNGSLVIESASGLADITAITIRDNASVTVYGDNTLTTVNVYGGTFRPLGSYTITNLKVGAAGKIDTTGSTGTVTVTNCEMEAKASIVDNASRITFSNAIDLGLAGLEDVTLRLGKGINVLPS
jgi:hypothetical protein